MAPTPETLSNNLAFLQVDLVDPDFHKHAHAHSRAVQALIGGSLLQWAIDRDSKVTDRMHQDLDTLVRPRRKARRKR